MSRAFEQNWCTEEEIMREIEDKRARVTELEKILNGWKTENERNQMDAKLLRDFDITKHVTVVLVDLGNQKPFQRITKTTKALKESKMPVREAKKVDSSSDESGNNESSLKSKGVNVKRAKVLKNSLQGVGELKKSLELTRIPENPSKESQSPVKGWKKIDSESSSDESAHGSSPKSNQERVKRNKALKRFYCKECDYPCGSERTFGIHQRTYHKPDLKKDYACAICGKLFFAKHFTLNHYKLSHPGKMKRCMYCSSWLQVSEFSTHGNAPLLKCTYEDCDRTYYCKNLFDRHIEGHNMAYPCEICGQKFTLLPNMRQHARRVHEKEKKFFCKCGTGYLFAKDLRRHEKIWHPATPRTKDFSCELCDGWYISKRAVRDHIIRVHFPSSLKFPCNSCQMSFETQKKHDYHVKWSHGPKNIKCDQCHAMFTCNSKLTRHKNCCHRKKKEQVFQKCKICGKKVREDNWKRHNFLHKSKNQFKCDGCGFRAKLKFMLLSHIFTHFPAPKPYKCRLCSYATRTPAELKNHMVFHSGERNFKCPYCKATYITRGCVLRHIKNGHKGKEMRVLDIAKKS